MQALLFLIILLFLHFVTTMALTTPNFTATFFIGDSTLDTGNNMFIPTLFQANHTPYGLTFADQTPTGRFSDGLLVPDLLTSLLNIKPLSPPYLDPNLTDEEIQTGVNFASAGSGYDNLTSSISNTLSVLRQVDMFGEYVERLKRVVGEEEGRRIVEGGLVMLSAGGNDVIFNYYDLPRGRKGEYDMNGYQDFLHGLLKDAVESVYNYGGRNFIVAGLPPIGCLPIQISSKFKNLFSRKCIDDQISDTIAYNAKLQKLLPELQRSLNGSKISYLDITDNIVEIINTPEKYGFDETSVGCCGTGLMEVGPLCNTKSTVCGNVSSFMFFDAIHPTERIYKLVAEHIMNNVIPEFS